MRKACRSGVAALSLAFGPNGADAMALREEGPSAHAPPRGSPSAPTQEGLAASIGRIRSIAGPGAGSHHRDRVFSRQQDEIYDGRF